MSTDPYEILGIGHDASPEEIQQAYRQLVLKHDPARNPTDSESVEKLARIQDAYKELLPPEHDEPVGVFHTHASIYQTVSARRRPTRRARPWRVREITRRLIAMATIWWLFLCGLTFVLMSLERTTDLDVKNAAEYQTDSVGHHAESDNVDANRDGYRLIAAAGPFIILITVIYVVFIIIVVAVAYS